MSSIYSIGQMNRLANRLEEIGFTPDDVTKLGQSKEKLRQIRGVVRKSHKIETIKPVIDCDADPSCYDDVKWKVKKHHKRGELKLDISKITLYLSKGQKDGNKIEGLKLLKELEGELTLNANVLDFFLKNNQFIPEEWAREMVFFWGTIYCHSSGSLGVRCLKSNDKGEWFDSMWDFGRPGHKYMNYPSSNTNDYLFAGGHYIALLAS